MTFQSVFVALQDLFPLVDARALRAVAMEHSKDADAAVVAVLEELIPFFTERSKPNSSLSQSVESSDGCSSVGIETFTQVQNDHSIATGEEQPSGCTDDGISKPFNDLCKGNHIVKDYTVESTSLSGSDEETIEEIIPFFTERSTPNSPLSQTVELSDGCSSVRIETITQVQNDHSIASGNTQPSCGTDDGLSKPFNDACLGHDIVKDYTAESTSLSGSHEETPVESSIETSCGSIPKATMITLQDVEMGIEQKNIQEKEDVADWTNSDASTDASGSELALVQAPDMHGSALEISNISLSTDTASNGKNMIDSLGIEEESASNVTMSSQFHIIDAMEEDIANARNNKKTLFLEMETVVNLMKLVEQKEQAVEQAKTEAAMGGKDLLNQVEELKRMLCRAKEANDMHAGEVYGEKAILTTELKELQSRLLSLSDERDKSLADLDEMRQSLEVRLAAAENEIKTAELEKLEMEEIARRDLVKQELIMEKVVKESKILKQQAEDNAQLQEFLVDRGHIVDMLQGEIAVICQDVKLLKEKFDQNVPLDKSLFSSHTSFILASSASSLKSLAPDQETLIVRDHDQLSTDNNRYEEKVPEATAEENSKVLIEDDGWELCDSSEANA